MCLFVFSSYHVYLFKLPFLIFFFQELPLLERSDTLRVAWDLLSIDSNIVLVVIREQAWVWQVYGRGAHKVVVIIHVLVILNVHIGLWDKGSSLSVHVTDLHLFCGSIRVVSKHILLLSHPGLLVCLRRRFYPRGPLLPSTTLITQVAFTEVMLALLYISDVERLHLLLVLVVFRAHYLSIVILIVVRLHRF